MENADGKIDDNGFSVQELRSLRTALYLTLQKIDEILGVRNLNGKVLAEHIFSGACTYFKTTPFDIRRKDRAKSLVNKRRLIVGLLDNYTDRTQEQIAQMMGYENHATVIHHIKQYKNLLSDEFYGNEEFKKTNKQLIKHLKL